MQDIFLRQIEITQNNYGVLSHKDLLFLPKRKKVEKVEKIVGSIENKEKCHTRKNFKASTKSWINTKNVHRVTEFNQEHRQNHILI